MRDLENILAKYKKRKYIIILGSGRNGTTFLAKELAKTKYITATPEDKFFFWTLSNRKKYNLDNMEDFLNFFNRGFNFIFNFRKQDFFYSEKEIINRKEYYLNVIKNNFIFIKKLKNNKKYKLLLDMILDIFAENNQKEYFVLHTPATLLVLDEVMKIIKPYKMVFMQRSLYTFYVSAMKGNNKWFKSSLDCIAYWNVVSNYINKYKNKFFKNSILIYQEEMLKNPKLVKNKLSDFLELDIKELCLKSRNENTYFNTYFDRKQLLTDEEIKLINFFGKKNLLNFNYNLLNKENINNISFFIKLHYFVRINKLKFNYFLRKKGLFFK